MASCEDDSVSSEEEMAKQSLREQLTSMRQQVSRCHGSGHRPSEPAKLPLRKLSDIAAALEVQQDCLLKLLDAQDKQEAMLQSQAKWIVRQVVNTLRNRLGQSPPSAQKQVGTEPPEPMWSGAGRRGSTETFGGPTWDSLPSFPSDLETDAPAMVPAPSKGKHYSSEASLAPSEVSVRVSRSSAALSDFSVATDGTKLTAPEELHNLEDKLNRLKESDKSFFFWGLTNSGESQRFDERSTLGTFAYKCTHSVLFEILVPIFIIANACTIGYQADWDMRHHGEQGGSQDMPIWIWINRAFALVFFLEITLRIASEGLYFFRWKNKGFGWNAFDSLIVASSLVEEVAALAFATRRTRMSSFRVVRVLRLVRALRVIRILRFFRELRIMVSGIMSCGKSLLWASLLITIMTYTFSVVFLQASLAYLEGPEIGMADGMIANVDCRYEFAAECSIRKNFNSLVGGMYTLFKAMSGGPSWGDVSDALTDISPVVTFAFCVYIMMAVFVVLNVIQMPAANLASALAQKRSRKDVEFKTRSISVSCLNWRES